LIELEQHAAFAGSQAGHTVRTEVGAKKPKATAIGVGRLTWKRMSAGIIPSRRSRMNSA
jgi:hypothetical protein